jgi:hypothetical protein
MIASLFSIGPTLALASPAPAPNNNDPGKAVATANIDPQITATAPEYVTSMKANAPNCFIDVFTAPDTTTTIATTTDPANIKKAPAAITARSTTMFNDTSQLLKDQGGTALVTNTGVVQNHHGTAIAGVNNHHGTTAPPGQDTGTFVATTANTAQQQQAG